MLPVAKPWFGAEEEEAVLQPLRRGWVTQGPEVAAFEEEFAAAVGAAYACAASSCTAALELALMALDVGPGDEVITVSHSFVATANSIRAVGAVPVFVDIEPETFNLDVSRLDDARTDRTRAVLCVHQMGLPCDMGAVVAFARRHGLAVIEDAACAVGSEREVDGAWQRVGRPWGDIACFSFHPRKLVTTGDGGMLTTSDRALDERFRLLRQHGMSVSDLARHGVGGVVFEQYVVPGHNFRMTDLQAAVGRVQLRRLDAMVDRRRHLARRYQARLVSLPVIPPREPQGTRSNFQSYCVRLPDGTDQRVVMEAMLRGGVSTRRGVMCAHLEPAYLDAQGWRAAGPLVQSERATRGSLILPLFHEMRDEDIDVVVEALARALGG